MVSSLVSKWKGHGFESHSVQIHWNIKYSDGSYDTVQKCWMVLVVHGELVTRIVAMEWLNALEHTANVCMRNNKARFKTMRHS